MSKFNSYTGFAIAIAWPETYCKQPGYWYDSVTNFFGITNNHYYKVGHAALVLVNYETKNCYYFDFGRYHTPFQHGRVRSEQTDPLLKMKTKAIISNDGNVIENHLKIITELQLNPECHGEGKLYSSYCKINFKEAFKKANKLQQLSPIPYGPFRFKGSNCSRFVRTALLGGKPSFKYRLKLNFLVFLTPTPLNNVNSLDNIVALPKLLKNDPFCPIKINDKSILKTTLPEPARNNKIPEKAQWLSGEGCGSWLNLTFNNGNYEITRISPQGEIEFQGEFVISNNKVFDINLPYKFEHLSHFEKVNIKQDINKIEFKNKN